MWLPAITDIWYYSHSRCAIRRVRNKVSISSRSSHLRIAKNMMLVSIFLGVGKLAGAFKEMAIAFRFGTSELVDLYVLVLTFALWIPSVWAAVSTSVLVPLTHSLPPEERKQFHSELSAWLGVISLILAFVAIVSVPVLVDIIGATGKYAVADIQQLIHSLTLVALITMVLAHYNALLLVDERHVNTLLNGIPSLTLLVFVLFNPDVSTVASFSFGSIAGVLVHIAVVIFILRGSVIIGWPRFTFQSAGWLDFRKAIGIMVLSNTIISFAPIIDQLIASTLEQGSIATLGYALRLLALFLGLGATAVGRAILPVLSREANIRNQLEMAMRWFAGLFLGGIIVGAVAWVVAPLIVKLMYERGAFLSDDTIRVSETLRYGLVQIPFFFAGIVLVQYFASRKLYKVLLMSSVVALVVKLISGYALAMLFGVKGIALSTGLMYVGTFVFLFGTVFLQRRALAATEKPLP